MRPFTRALIWLVPLALYSGDASAWGLYTHLYFAQLLLWAVPLLDARFRRALKRFPELVLAGACLPDVALVSNPARVSELSQTHQWSAACRLLQNASDDTERAIALGYTCHLLTDVIAHHHFVPVHEILWIELPMVTHAAAEWAMDAHVAPQLFARPARLIAANLKVVSFYAAAHFGCAPTSARRALRYLLWGEATLRKLLVPNALYLGARLADARSARRFDHYTKETTIRLCEINRIIAGDSPAWHPEGEARHPLRARIRKHTSPAFAHRIALPSDLFKAEAAAA